MAVHLLHGFLEVQVFEADHLHHAFTARLLQAAEEQALHLSHSKLYVDVEAGAATIARTREVEFHPTNPVWNQTFRLYSAFPAAALTFTLKNQLLVGAKVIAVASFPTSSFASGDPFQGLLDLKTTEHDQHHHHLNIHLHRHNHHPQLSVLVRFIPATASPSWGAGITPDYSGLIPAFFPQRNYCGVTLYQNAHLSDDYKPPITLDGGRHYQPARYFEDLYLAIHEAKHIIYVAGWLVNTAVTLVRDPRRMIAGAKGVTFGGLLKEKAEEGVSVLVMVWQDRTSQLGNAGVMGTHDEETRNFFEGSKVKCFLCPRNADPTLTVVEQVETGLEFTHHQKTITVDVATHGAGTDSRHIVSFIGGIDISDGRYDDENHTLFNHLDTTYAQDFLQKNLKGADLRHGGPREPWHDIHSKLEGPAALDVLTNFQQRWLKQAPPELADCLDTITAELFPHPHFNMKDSWNVQVFRSIDEASVVGFPANDPLDAADMGLVSHKGVTVDQSIHSAYVEAIRRAKRFIYIENQYFMGSCASWKEDRDIGLLNLVPVEIALKIASKIKSGERFAAYIVTPMWPEGVPEGDKVQAILHWNRMTIEMMYGMVGEAIEEAGLTGKAHPCDYLNFFCLANREAPRDGEYVPLERPEEGSDYYKAQVNRRFMIYVHAKLMIVDDEYVMVGSANINERSLAGDRDTEIAYGSYQPGHLTLNAGARGGVHGFRMSLWYEHFMSHLKHGPFEAINLDAYLDPEHHDCVRSVRLASQQLWRMYNGDKPVDLPGHLLPFPIAVSDRGELSDLPPDGCFPDTTAPVRGTKSAVLPPLLTT